MACDGYVKWVGVGRVLGPECVFVHILRLGKLPCSLSLCGKWWWRGVVPTLPPTIWRDGRAVQSGGFWLFSWLVIESAVYQGAQDFENGGKTRDRASLRRPPSSWQDEPLRTSVEKEWRSEVGRDMGTLEMGGTMLCNIWRMYVIVCNSWCMYHSVVLSCCC